MKLIIQGFCIKSELKIKCDWLMHVEPSEYMGNLYADSDKQLFSP